MFVRIDNRPRDYAWGSRTAIAELLGTASSGGPEAELWLGAHPGSPSAILDPSRTGGAADLAAWIARDPALAIGRGGADPSAEADEPLTSLPYLLKVLAAEMPLSLQAHPSPTQAAEGFRRENERGVPLGDPRRNYKDTRHKPELIYALSPVFEALCGFREPAEAAAALAELEGAAPGSAGPALASFRLMLSAGHDETPDGAAGPVRAAAPVQAAETAESVGAAEAADPAESTVLRGVVRWLLSGVPAVAELVAAVTEAARLSADASARDAQTVRMLADAFPGDPGIVIALLMNRVTLSQGEALYLPAGNVHAYLRGLGVEVMASSDNVLRGGLTPKHVDAAEFLDVVSFAPVPPPLLRPERVSRGVEVFRPDVPDFALTHVALGSGQDRAEVPLPGPAIALCTAGTFDLAGRQGSSILARGEAVYVTPDEERLVVTGAGTLFVATPNERASGASGAAR